MGQDGDDLFIFQEGGGHDRAYGGSGASWIDTIDLKDGGGGSDIGDYGSDWTVTLTEGEIVSQESDSLTLSNDADGHITLEDGSRLDFQDIETIQW